MENLARKLANEISKTLGYDDEKEQIIAYGLITMFQIAVTVAIVSLGALVIGTAIEALIICFSVSLLRKYSGGAHLRFIELCTFFGVIYCIVFSAISKYILEPLLNTAPMLIIITVIYSISFLVVYRVAPVDSPNKPIKSEKKKKRMRKGSFAALSAYLAISLIFVVLGLRNQTFNSYGISLVFGLLWQITTLTKPGTRFLNKINFIASYIRMRKEAN